MWTCNPPQVEATYKVEELDIDQIEREEEERVSVCMGQASLGVY